MTPALPSTGLLHLTSLWKMRTVYRIQRQSNLTKPARRIRKSSNMNSPALLTSTSSGRPPSSALPAKVRMVERSARSTETASTFAPGTSALHAGGLVDQALSQQEVYPEHSCGAGAQAMDQDCRGEYLIWSLAARPFTRFLQARTVA